MPITKCDDSAKDHDVAIAAARESNAKTDADLPRTMGVANGSKILPWVTISKPSCG